MARTLELDTITEPSNSGTANITLSSDTTTTMPLVDINGGAIDATTVGAGTPSSVAATTLTASGATTLSDNLTVSGVTALNGNTTLGNASSDTVTVTATMSGVDNKSGMTGEIRMWAGSSAPTGWLFCDGASVSRSTYAALYAITGDAFGTASGSTFNVPDMKGRVPAGVGTGAGDAAEDNDGGTVPSGTALTARSLGEWTGQEAGSTTTLPAHTHTMKNHTHTWSTNTGANTGNTGSTTPGATGSAGSHSHTIYGPWGAPHYTQDGIVSGSNYYVGLMDNRAPNSTSNTAGAHTHTSAAHTHTLDNHHHTTSGTTAAPNDNTSDSTGSTGKHTIPIMCVNFIIKT